MIEKGHRPKDPYVAQVYDVVIGNTQDEEIVYALDLVRVPEHKETLQAFFLGGASDQDVCDALDITVTVVEHVHKLVMDENQFRNKLERFTYAKDLVEAEDVLTERGADYIRMSMLHGPDILAQHFHLGNEEIKVDVKKLVGHFIETAYYLSANARGNSITSETVKQSRLWMLDILKYAEAHSELQSMGNATSDALLAIEERKATVSVEELGLNPDDIYH